MCRLPHLSVIVEQNDILGLASSHALQVTAAVGRPAARVPLNVVALEGVAQLLVHLLLLPVCQNHHWPA